MATETASVRKAWKLIEALAEECEQPAGDEHAWRRCRRCLAVAELDRHSARALLRTLLETRETQPVQPLEVPSLVGDV